MEIPTEYLECRAATRGQCGLWMSASGRFPDHLLEIRTVGVYVCDRLAFVVRYQPRCGVNYGLRPKGGRSDGSFAAPMPFRPNGKSITSCRENVPGVEVLATGQGRCAIGNRSSSDQTVRAWWRSSTLQEKDGAAASSDGKRFREENLRQRSGHVRLNGHGELEELLHALPVAGSITNEAAGPHHVLQRRRGPRILGGGLRSGNGKSESRLMETVLA